MLDFIVDHWFIEALVCIAGAMIIGYGLCWLFDNCERKD